MHQKIESRQLKLNIPYERKLLWSIIKAMKLDTNKNEQASKFLDSIEEQIAIVRHCSSLEFTSQSASKIQSALSIIRLSAESFFTDYRYVHPTLPNTLRNVLTGWIEPIEREVNRQALDLKSGLSREELDHRTLKLYNEQRSLNEQALKNHLAQIKKLFSGYSTPRCYIAYVPPAERNTSEESWVEPFLSTLYDHLTAAGISPVMELRDLRPGEDWNAFTRQYKNGNPIILIGTASLHDCAEQPKMTILRVINNTIKTTPHLIYPLLISGHAKTAFPEEFDFGSNIINGHEGYIATLKELMSRLFKIAIQQNEEEYHQLWVKFDTMLEAPSKNSAIENNLTGLNNSVKQLGLFNSFANGGTQKKPPIPTNNSPSINHSSDNFSNEAQPGISFQVKPSMAKKQSKESDALESEQTLRI